MRFLGAVSAQRASRAGDKREADARRFAPVAKPNPLFLARRILLGPGVRRDERRAGLPR